MFGFIWELFQGRGKVISRSQRGQISSKRLKIDYWSQPNPSTHVDIGWCLVFGFIGELSQGHGKVITKSNQMKTVKQTLFLLFLLTLCSLEMCAMAGNIPNPQHRPTAKHPDKLKG